MNFIPKNISKKTTGIISMAVAIVLIVATIIGAAYSSSSTSTPDEAVKATFNSTVMTLETSAATEEVVTSEPKIQVTEVETESVVKETSMPQEEVVEVEEPEITQTESVVENNYNAAYAPGDLRFQGVIYWNGWRWTWYSERVLPGGGLSIPGRHTEDGEGEEPNTGFVCDGDGYICLASGSLSKGTIVDTPFGRPGKVYDCGCASDVLDVYVNW